MNGRQFNIKVFSDGADLDDIKHMNSNELISGITTNPSLIRRAGVENYISFCKNVCEIVKDKSLSLEVISDDWDIIEKQARFLATLGDNIYVKIPITNSKGESCHGTLSKLNNDGIKCNITAVLTSNQIDSVIPHISKNTPNYISIFAGRIADTGIDPSSTIKHCVQKTKDYPHTETLWASTREIYNLFQAQDCKCDIITVPPNILKKFSLIGKNLEVLSRETVQMFFNDAISSGFKIRTELDSNN